MTGLEAVGHCMIKSHLNNFNVGGISWRTSKVQNPIQSSAQQYDDVGLLEGQRASRRNAVLVRVGHNACNGSESPAQRKRLETANFRALNQMPSTFSHRRGQER